MLQAGQISPDFSLPNADMEMVSLSGFKGKNVVVLYFYPKDDTPGCTVQALEFGDLEEEFAKLDTVILGISRDDCLSHGTFRDKHGITVQLLADTESEACNLYGVLQEKEVDGRQKMSLVRSTFIIDKQGVLRHVFQGVNPRGHAAEILKLIRGM